jgi:hypothetical protein
MFDKTEDSQMQLRIRSTTFQSLTNWLTGIFLILLGLYHNLAGGSLIGQWLQSLNPPISANDINMGQLGFEMGGYLAMAIGLTFIFLGNSLPRGYYLFWAIFFLMLGGISLYTFKSFHESQLVWLLTILLGACYSSFIVICNYRNLQDTDSGDFAY